MTRMDEIEARLNAITPGKWHSYDENSVWSKDVFVAEADHERDVPFIVAAPDDIRYLLDEVKRLQDKLIPAPVTIADAYERELWKHGRLELRLQGYDYLVQKIVQDSVRYWVYTDLNVSYGRNGNDQLDYFAK